MISWIDSGAVGEHRDELKAYVLRMKSERPFVVLDVGGGVNGWAAPIRDYCVDMVSAGPNSIVGDVFSETTWESVRALGKIDLVILSHILEDVRDPMYILDKVSEIAGEVFVSVPHKCVELYPVEAGCFVGHHHHRWVFGSDGSSLVIVPKTAAANIFLSQGLSRRLRTLVVAGLARLGMYGARTVFAGGLFHWLGLERRTRRMVQPHGKQDSLSFRSATPVPLTIKDYISDGSTLVDHYIDLLELRF